MIEKQVFFLDIIGRGEAFSKKRTDIATKHIVESLHKGKEYKLFEDQISEKFVLYKIRSNKRDETNFAKTPDMKAKTSK